MFVMAFSSTFYLLLDEETVRLILLDDSIHSTAMYYEAYEDDSFTFKA